MAKPRIMFDHDGRHPLIYMYEPPMYREELEAAVDELAGTPVEALMLTLGDIRSLLYDTKAGELWGQNIKKWPHAIWRRAHQNFRKLIEEGNDPLRVLCERAHAKGLLLYATLLVQQGGRERMLQSWEKEDFAERDWQLDVQPLDIGARGDVDPNWPGYRCPDFKHGQVRGKILEVIEEVLQNYPVDGFELQLNYEPYYFHPDEVEEGRRIMSEWIGQVHEAIKKSDPERELAIRVPASIEGGLAIGLDPLTWIGQGIVDVLIPEASGMADPSVDFSPLVEVARGSECRIHAAIQSRVSSDRIGEGTIEMIRATACNFWDQGIDGVYLAHWFGCWPYKADFYEKLREVPHPDIMATKDKFYRMPTSTDAPAKPVVAPHTADPLPAELEEGRPVQLDFRVSDDLSRWGERGRVHEVLLRVRVVGTTELDHLGLALNGRELPVTQWRRINEMYRMSSPRYRVFGQWFAIRLEQDHWPSRGRNTLEVTLHRRDPEVTVQIAVRDVELEVKYLMGKNFHRGFVDQDLGPYEHLVT